MVSDAGVPHLRRTTLLHTFRTPSVQQRKHPVMQIQNQCHLIGRYPLQLAARTLLVCNATTCGMPVAVRQFVSTA
jgi:hypothetical protein